MLSIACLINKTSLVYLDSEALAKPSVTASEVVTVPLDHVRHLIKQDAIMRDDLMHYINQKM